jgi:glucose-1-phosphate thymidylyltransferase
VEGHAGDMIEATTAVVLAAGLGNRMRRDTGASGIDAAQASAAARGLKAMIPDAQGRPFLDHILSSLADGGVSDVCLVIGPAHDAIRDHYALRPPQRIALAYVVQQTPTGTADAMLAAEPWVAGRDVLVVNADNLYPVAAIRALVELGAPGCVAFDRATLVRESNIEPARIGAFAVMTLRPDGLLTGIVEKPRDTAGDWISMNIWRFDHRIFAACRDVPLSPRNEHELPLAVALAIDRGMQLRAVRLSAGVLDLSSRGDIADLSRRLGDREIRP